MSEFKVTEGMYLGVQNTLLSLTNKVKKLEKKESRKEWQKAFLEGFKIGLQFQLGQKPKLKIKAVADPAKK